MVKHLKSIFFSSSIITILVIAALATFFSPGKPFSINATENAPLNAPAVLKPTKYDFSRGYADLVDDLVPAVVNISTTHLEKVQVNDPFETFRFFFNQPDLFNNQNEDVFKFFNNQAQRNGGAKKKMVERKTSSLGSGFIIDPEGLVVTNYHVIKDATEIKITLDTGSEFPAEVIGYDVKTDVALMKMKVKNKVPYVQFGNSDKARVGDAVIAIGNPFGLGRTVTSGIISATSRSIGVGPLDEFLQTDAAINRGNSGGPMFNLDGEVIGVNAAIYSTSGGSIGIGFAMPSNTVKYVIEQLKNNKSIQRGWLGVVISEVSDEIADSVGLVKKEGVKNMGAFVVSTNDKSPAQQQGIKPGDVILAVDKLEVTNPRDISKYVANSKPGAVVKLKLWRLGKEQIVKVKLGKLQDEPIEKEKSEDVKNTDFVINTKIGLALLELSNKNKEKYNIKYQGNGLMVVKVDENLAAMTSSLKEGDVIISVNNVGVATVSEFEEVVARSLAQGRSHAIVRIVRDGEKIFETIDIKK